MRAEKSKRFLLIFRRVLTSSSSSLTWIVRCSWSPTRFCEEKHDRRAAGTRPQLWQWRLLPQAAANPEPFHPLPSLPPVQELHPLPPHVQTPGFAPSPPSPAWHSTPRARSAQKRTPKGSAPAGSASPTPEELSPFPSSSTSGHTSSRPSPGSSPRSPARTGQDGFRGPPPNSPRAGYPPQELSPSGDRHGQGTEQLWGSWQTGQGQADVPMSLWLFTAQDSPVLPPDAPGLEPSPGGRAEPTARHRAGRTNDCTSQDCKGSVRRENGFHCTGEQSSGRGQ